MGADGHLHYQITGDSGGLTAALDGGLSRLEGMITPAKAAAAALTAITAAAVTAGLAIREAMNMETVQTGINTMLKNADLTKGVMLELRNLARDTPFELGDLAGAAKQLIAGGTSVGQLREELTTLGDLASGAQTDLAGLVLVFNQVRAAGKLMGGDMMQLNQRGIGGLREALAAVKGIELRELAAAIEAGRVSADDLYAAFQRLTGEGGVFFNAMKDQSATLEGLISSLRDDWSAFLNVLGQPMLEPAKAAVKELSAELQSLAQGAAAFGIALQDAYQTNPSMVGEMLEVAVTLGAKKGFNAFLELAAKATDAFGKMFAQAILNNLKDSALGPLLSRLAPDFGGGFDFTKGFDTSAEEKRMREFTAEPRARLERQAQEARDALELKKQSDELKKKAEETAKGAAYEKANPVLGPQPDNGATRTGIMGPVFVSAGMNMGDWGAPNTMTGSGGMSRDMPAMTNPESRAGGGAAGGTSGAYEGGGAGFSRGAAFDFGSEQEDSAFDGRRRKIYGYSARRKAIMGALGVGEEEASRISKGLRAEQRDGTSGKLESLTNQVLAELKRIRTE